jgi:hypothetical protein
MPVLDAASFAANSGRANRSMAIISFSGCKTSLTAMSSLLLRRQLRLYSSVAESNRPISIGFIGLGRMGFEMAYNLFSKTYNHSSDSQFFICDAVPECAQTFSDAFLKEFPRASLRIARTPEE